MCFSEIGFETRPGSVHFWFAVPFSDVAGKDGRSGDEDESNVDELSQHLGGFGRFGHVGIVIDCSEDVHNRFGVVVGCTIQGGLGGGQGLWSSDDSILAVKQFFHDL